MIRVAGIVQNSIVDGVGIRFTVFVQGCPHHCEGCHNPQTWSFGGGKLITAEKIISMMADDPCLSGITFSGGEPFTQAGELVRLAQWAHAHNLDVWCYTGWTYDELIKRNERKEIELLKNIDMLVDGRFEIARKSYEFNYRGSANQRILKLEGGVIVGQY